MKIYAPWTQKEVDALNRYQKSGVMHPFTCSEEHGKEAVLEATIDGWICPIPLCYYTQNWAFDFMLNIGLTELGDD